MVLNKIPEADVKLILPVPEVADSPIAGLLFVQLNTAPVVPVKLTATGWPEHTLTLAGAVIVGGALTVKVTGVLVVLAQPVAGSRVSAKKVYTPADSGPAGVKELEPDNNAVPPVAAANQSTTIPVAAVTVNAGIGAPAQTEGLLGLPGAVTGGQIQVGEVTVCCCGQF